MKIKHVNWVATAPLHKKDFLKNLSEICPTEAFSIICFIHLGSNFVDVDGLRAHMLWARGAGVACGKGWDVISH